MSSFLQFHKKLALANNSLFNLYYLFCLISVISAYFHSLQLNTSCFIIHVEYNSQQNAQLRIASSLMREIMSAMKAEEKAAETDREEREKWNGGRDYESGERFGRPLSLHHAGQLPCNFVYVGKQLSRSHFSFFSPLVSPPYVLVRSLTLSPSSRFLFLSALATCVHRHNYKLSAISSVPGRSCPLSPLMRAF